MAQRYNVKHVCELQIEPGQRWVYSAGFNVSSTLVNASRIEAEVEDLLYLLERGARVSILSHQGSYHDGSAQSLEFVAKYLSSKLHKNVEYFPESIGPWAERQCNALSAGNAILLGNVRQNEGEEKNDLALAEQYSRFGNYVAIGGFCKAHRTNASNTGILKFLPGAITRSFMLELEQLLSWMSPVHRNSPSVAVIGGIKKEKVLNCFPTLLQKTDVIVLGGGVLNTVLVALGYEVGESALIDNSPSLVSYIRTLIKEGLSFANVHLPEAVIVARKSAYGYVDIHKTPLCSGVPSGYRIVDFVMRDDTVKMFHDVVACGGRFLFAGTPSLCGEGFSYAVSSIDNILRNYRPDNILIMGGNSVEDLPIKGTQSTGGGAALEFIAKGELSVLTALVDNNRRFSCCGLASAIRAL